MSAFGGPQTADDEREERRYCGIEEGWGDGDVDLGPELVVEPLAPKVVLEKRPTLCHRPRLGSRGRTCFGVVRNGVCTSCFRTPRGTK